MSQAGVDRLVKVVKEVGELFSFCIYTSLVRAYMYALCVPGTVNMQGFVWNLFLCAAYFIHHSFLPLLGVVSFFKD